jgi:hypothetical protein
LPHEGGINKKTKRINQKTKRKDESGVNVK